MVVDEGFSVYRASRMLKINGSTAKTIVRNYRKNGTIFKRKKEEEKTFSESGSEEVRDLQLQEEEVYEAARQGRGNRSESTFPDSRFFYPFNPANVMWLPFPEFPYNYQSSMMFYPQ